MAKKKSEEKTTEKFSIPATHRDVAATAGLVWEVRDELKTEIRSLEHKMESRFKAIDSRFETMSSEIQQVLVAVHRTQALVEEQRGENRIVLDGIKSLMERQDRVEADVKKMEHTMAILAKTKREMSQ